MTFLSLVSFSQRRVPFSHAVSSHRFSRESCHEMKKGFGLKQLDPKSMDCTLPWTIETNCIFLVPKNYFFFRTLLLFFFLKSFVIFQN